MVGLYIPLITFYEKIIPKDVMKYILRDCFFFYRVTSLLPIVPKPVLKLLKLIATLIIAPQKKKKKKKSFKRDGVYLTKLIDYDSILHWSRPMVSSTISALLQYIIWRVRRHDTTIPFNKSSRTALRTSGPACRLLLQLAVVNIGQRK